MFRDVLLDMVLPGRCSGVPSVRAAYVIGISQAILLPLASINHELWPLSALGMGLLLPQLFLNVGIVWAKVREVLPQPVGHAEMFSDPPPLIGVGWIHCLGGLFISAGVIAAAFDISNAI